METKLLDSAHGRAGEKRYILEQYWMVGDGDLADGDTDLDVVHITVQYVEEQGLKNFSSATLVCLTTADEEGNPVPTITLNAYPSQWWKPIVASGDEEEPPELLVEVARGLLDRFVTFAERVMGVVKV